MSVWNFSKTEQETYLKYEWYECYVMEIVSLYIEDNNDESVSLRWSWWFKNNDHIVHCIESNMFD